MDSREAFDRTLSSLSDCDVSSGRMGPNYKLPYKTLQLNALAYAPKTLYKYFNVENADRSINDLRSGRLYLASPVHFDDNYDVRPVCNKNIVEETLRRQITRSNMEDTDRFLGQFHPREYDVIKKQRENNVRHAGGFDNYKEAFIRDWLKNYPKAIEHFRRFPRCACLAEQFDSTEMWGLYASKHRGFVAGYNTSACPPSCYCANTRSKDPRCRFEVLPLTLAPVVYSGRRDLTGFMDVFGGSQLFVPYPTDHLYLALLNATLYKGKNWASQKEWRLVTLVCQHAKKETMYARMSPTALYIGSETSNEVSEKLLALAHGLHIPAYKEVITYDVSKKSMQFEKVC